MNNALEIEPNNFRVLFNMGVLLKDLGREEEAKEYYKKSIEKNLYYPYSYLNLAVLYREKMIFIKR